MIDGREERNRLPTIRPGVTLAAHLQREHEIEIRQPVLAATFARQRRASAQGATVPDVGGERSESAHPVFPAANGVAVLRIVALEAGTGLIHVNAIRAE